MMWLTKMARFWLRIERLQREPPPVIAPHLAKWIVVSRDPHSAPRVQDVILETMKTVEAQALANEGKVDAPDIMPAAHGESDNSDVRIRLDRHPEIESAVKAYISGPWKDWSETEKVRRETIAIYDKFFATVQSIETEGADNPIEVVLGLGIALWQVKDKTVEHPLIEALVEIDIDQQTHAIRLRPRDTDPQLYIRPFVELGTPGLTQLEDIARKHFATLTEEDSNASDPTLAVFSPFVPESYQSILVQAASRLSSSGVYDQREISDRTVPRPSDTLTITDTWAIYVRPRSANLFVQDIQRLKNNIESQSDEDLPPSNKRWVSPPETGDRSLDNINLGIGIGQGSSNTAIPQASGFSDRDVLFPKPFNDAQIEIVARLAQDDGVVVQGPPGTGKTHTIANIICHYLATGRNVLVVSKGEPALEVLRDQIPAEVRGLTISLLTNERQGLKQLESAVTFMANHVANQDAGKLDSRRQQCEQEILALHKTILDLDNQMRVWAKRHLTPVSKQLTGEDGQYPADLAELISDQRHAYEWLDDTLGPDDTYEPRFTAEDIISIREARCEVGHDLIYLGMDLPHPNDLPSAAVICAVHDDLRRASEMSRIAESKHLPALSARCDDPWNRAESLLERLRNVKTLLSVIDHTAWFAPIYGHWLTQGVETDMMVPLRQLVVEIDRLTEMQQVCFATNVSIPQMGQYREEVVDAVRRASKGERAFSLLSLGKADAKEIVKKIYVDGEKPESPTAWQKVMGLLEYQKARTNLLERWNKIAATFGLPVVSPTASYVDKWLNSTRALFQSAQSIVIEYRNRWREEIAILFPHGIDRDKVACDNAVLALAMESLESALSQHKLSAARSTIENVESRLATCGGPASLAARQFLRETVGSPNNDTQQISDQWRDHLREFERLRNLQPQLDVVTRVSALAEASGATNWARRMRIEPALGDHDPWTPSNWENSWRHRRLEAYLIQIDGRSELKELSRRRVEEDCRLAKVMAEVIELRTYLGLKKRMTGGPLTALIQFAHAISQIGAGTGIRAQRYRGDARRAMQGCIGSVPCWIMPTWRVSEALPAQTGMFDLVVIDEASQSDAMALPVLLRAKKVLVVGDNRQVSPSPIGLEERRLLQLRRSYLRDQPFAAMLMPGTSLYDLAQAVFPGNRILLNEHFRCVEPIIRFSFQFYPEKIKPVRIPKPSERLDPPLVDVFIDGGQRNSNKVNEAEALAVVDEIERIVADPVYKDRSIGVVSLIGNQQAYRIQELLLERIGEDAYLQFRIACGDAATFQGKERNIMFVSMVASPGQCQAQTARLFEQRFNVALSRARDRMYLFRSVSPEDLRNPNDLKRRVLNHFQNPMPTITDVPAELISRCESEFERKVFRRLCTLGYRVTPQVSVGEFRIDLVVDGEADRRLAIELDGDRYHGPERWFDDWNRQKILERVGWTFWRCWASSYALAPDECIADLVETMNAMGIQPIGQTNKTHSYTEQRIIHVADATHAGNEDLSVQRVEIGDTLVISLDKEESHHRMLTLSTDEDDLENGIISVHGAIGKALLGASVEDEIELSWKGESRRATILSIENKLHAGTNGMSPERQSEVNPPIETIHAQDQSSEKDDSFVASPREGATSTAETKKTRPKKTVDISGGNGQKLLFTDEPQPTCEQDGINGISDSTDMGSDGSNPVTADLLSGIQPAWEMSRGEFHQYRCSLGYTNPHDNSKVYWQEIKKALDEGQAVNPQLIQEYERIFGS